jgi:hypothetical protein
VERKIGATALKPHAGQSKRHRALACGPFQKRHGRRVLDFFCRRLTL